MSDEYPSQYTEGIRLFNAQEFFACHDVIEELWTETLGEKRRFYQGLIQAAVALYHFGNDNLGGARKLYGSSRKYLLQYGSSYMGIDLQKFLADYQFCFQEMLDAGGTYPDGVQLKPERIPRIEFNPADQ